MFGRTRARKPSLHPVGRHHAPRGAVARGPARASCRSGSTRITPLNGHDQPADGLGDEAAGPPRRGHPRPRRRLAAIAAHGEALDRAASAARNDIRRAARRPAARRSDAPGRWPSTARSAGGEAVDKAAQFEDSGRSLTGRTREADAVVGEAAQRLLAQIAEIEAAAARPRAGRRRRASRPRPIDACCNAPPRRWKKSAAASTSRPRRSPRWSSKPRPDSGRPASNPPRRSASLADRAGVARRLTARSPSRNARRSG